MENQLFPSQISVVHPTKSAGLDVSQSPRPILHDRTRAGFVRGQGSGSSALGLPSSNPPYVKFLFDTSALKQYKQQQNYRLWWAKFIPYIHNIQSRFSDNTWACSAARRIGVGIREGVPSFGGCLSRRKPQ
jgi:hypothetical protein